MVTVTDYSSKVPQLHQSADFFYLLNVQNQLSKLDQQLNDEEITPKGYHKRKKVLLSQKRDVTLSEFCEPDLSSLPTDIVNKISELDTELREEEVTIKGYAKRRQLILQRFMLKEPDHDSLPIAVTNELNVLKEEYLDGDLTEKGFKKKKYKLLSPYLIQAHPEANLNSPGSSTSQSPVATPTVAMPTYHPRIKIVPRNNTEEERPSMVPSHTVNNMPDFEKSSQVVIVGQDATGQVFNTGGCESSFADGNQDNSNQVETENDTILPRHSSGELPCPDYDESPSMVKPGGGKKTMKRGAINGIQKVGTKGGKVFECEICGAVFNQAQSFSGHCKSHKNERKRAHQCPICMSSYTSRSHLQFHMTKHTGVFPFTCSYCGKGFAGKTQHRYHEKRHRGETPFICKLCGSRMWKEENFKKHLESCQKKIQDNMQVEKETTNGAFLPREPFLPKLSALQQLERLTDVS